MHSDGSGEAQRLTEGNTSEIADAFSPDGKRLAIYRIGNGGSWDIFTLPVEADTAAGSIGFRLGKPEPFLESPFDERNPRFSPDGRWLTYASNESGTLEVYVRPFPGPGGPRMVSAGGGHFAVWSRDGRDVLYLSRDKKVMAVSYSARGDSFTAGLPRVWAEARMRSISSASIYDLAPDGKRLAAIVADDANGDRPPTHLTFLLNFVDELRRRAPEGR